MAAKRRIRTEQPSVRVRATWNPEKLRLAIRASAKTQESVARAAGVPLRTLASYLARGAGSAAPGGARLVAIAEVLGADPMDWFDIEVIRTP